MVMDGWPRVESLRERKAFNQADLSPLQAHSFLSHDGLDGGDGSPDGGDENCYFVFFLFHACIHAHDSLSCIFCANLHKAQICTATRHCMHIKIISVHKELHVCMAASCISIPPELHKRGRSIQRVIKVECRPNINERQSFILSIPHLWRPRRVLNVPDVNERRYIKLSHSSYQGLKTGF